MRLSKLLFLPFALCGACGPAEVTGSVGVTVPVAAPTLAYVAPGVEVVSDWDAPVFFADDFYWYWDGGIWYRSAVLGGPRVVVRDVPVGIARIREPRAYVHYHATAAVARRPAPLRAPARFGGGMRAERMHRR